MATFKATAETYACIVYHILLQKISITSMKRWLDNDHLFSEGWRVDPKWREELLGVSVDDLDAPAGLTDQQKVFARAFARLGAPEMPSNKVAEYAHLQETRGSGNVQHGLDAISSPCLLLPRAA